MGFTLSIGDKALDFLLPSTEGRIYSLKTLTNPIGYNVKWEDMDPHWMPPGACDLV